MMTEGVWAMAPIMLHTQITHRKVRKASWQPGLGHFPGKATASSLVLETHVQPVRFWNMTNNISMLSFTAGQCGQCSGFLDSLVWCNQRSRLRGTWPRLSHTQDSQMLCDSCSYWCTWAQAVSGTAMSYGGGQGSGWGHMFILDVNISFTFKWRVHAEAQKTRIRRRFYLPV